MSRWKERLATLFLVVAVGLSLLPWIDTAVSEERTATGCPSLDYDWIRKEIYCNWLIPCYGGPLCCFDCGIAIVQ